MVLQITKQNQEFIQGEKKILPKTKKKKGCIKYLVWKVWIAHNLDLLMENGSVQEWELVALC